ncbi:MAG: chemotaxis protein [Nanoarchaeota archaeon]
MVKSKQDILLETGTNEVEIAEFGIKLKETGQFQSFGINVAKVREIIKVPKFIKIPNSQKNVAGVFKLRNNIIPLIDLGKWLDESQDVPLEESYVIVTEFNQSNFGFLIHKIETIHRMSWEKVQPPVNVKGKIKSDCITGVVLLESGKKTEKIMMMMDFEKIVSDINPEVSLSLITDEKIIKNLKAGTPAPKVILAEDSSIIRDLMAGILQKGGFEVVNVNNGKLAWEYINAWLEDAKNNNKPISDYLELIVTDIEMPQMDGHSLLRKIKENDTLKSVPVILFSSLIYDEIRRKGELIGADAQISKPEIGNLLNIVKEVLDKKKNK